MYKLSCGPGFHARGCIPRSGISGRITTQFKLWETAGLFFTVALLHIAMRNVREHTSVSPRPHQYCWVMSFSYSLPVFSVCFVF